MKKIATFGAGCFWNVEKAFRKVDEVLKVESGYTGGWMKNPNYGEVCTGITGHAETVRIEFDPKIISYKELLEIFFQIHDPTQVNRQGFDIGPQYRSVIYCHDNEQKKLAQELKSEKDFYNQPIVTEIRKAKKFYKAEDYHQNYLMKHNRLWRFM
jgi:peptide-methionine (S)-S-oxide reductase